MAGSRSRSELLKFLDYVGTKGLLSPATAESRKASVNKVLGILNDDEADDISKIDLEEITRRFANLHGQQYTADSLRTYKSRTKSSIEDFLRYVDNPLAFKVGGSKRQPKTRKQSDPKENGHSPANSIDLQIQTQATAPLVGDTILPISIRSNLTIYIQGLPYDLTEREAKKVSNVIMAMASPEE